MTPPGLVVGVDLGGTKTAAAVVAMDGSVGRIVTLPTRASRGAARVLDTVAEAVRAAMGPDGVLAGIGIGTAGAVDSTRGVIVSSTETFAGWVGTDLAAGLRDRLGPVVVRVHNDVDAHALGESWVGASAGAASSLMVAAGTGIGAGLILDGRLHTGARSLAGEIAHIPAVGAEGLRCPCGRMGHLEAVAAGPAILRRYHDLGGDREVPDARAVVAAGVAGDPLATRVVAAAATGLGRTLAGIVTTVDPDIVVVGGGLGQAGPLWWQPFEEALRSELLAELAGIPVLPASLGAGAAIVGAARSALDAMAEEGS